jgi:uncharacterized protein (TIGR02217 family)
VTRDGFVHFDEEKQAMQAFDEVSFPLAIGKGARVSPGFSTQIVTTASGHEQRNADWASGRLRFDAGPGVRSEADLQTLIAFFRARRGAARGFRFRDPYDYSSNAMTGPPGAANQLLGTGDGVRTSFALVKRYGDIEPEVRRITRPVAGSVLVSVDGTPVSSGWTLADGGMIVFTTPPASGAAIRAGFLFDVPVRFADDQLAVDADTWLAGDAPDVGLVEVREG